MLDNFYNQHYIYIEKKQIFHGSVLLLLGIYVAYTLHHLFSAELSNILAFDAIFLQNTCWPAIRLLQFVRQLLPT